MERYRSGHNEAVLKTVCPKGRVGSNPTLSAGSHTGVPGVFLCAGSRKLLQSMFFPAAYSKGMLSAIFSQASQTNLMRFFDIWF